jgi:F-type H+-transporting ATPase subunit b
VPQLNPADFAPQLIWLAITFTILYLLMARVALPRIGGVIAERKSRIASDIESAREAQRRSEQEHTRYDTQLAAAKAEGQQAIRAARDRLAAEQAAERAKADAGAAARISQAEARLQEFRARAKTQLQAMASGAVSDIVKRLAGVEVTGAEVEAALRAKGKEVQ